MFIFEIGCVNIDEFQGISVARYKLIKAILVQTGAKLLCVGNDWQSTYRFTGSDISLFTNFESYFRYADTMRIERTYTVQHTSVMTDNKRCPRCGGFTVRRKGRFGQFWGCSNYPTCNYTEQDN